MACVTLSLSFVPFQWLDIEDCPLSGGAQPRLLEPVGEIRAGAEEQEVRREQSHHPPFILTHPDFYFFPPILIRPFPSVLTYFVCLHWDLDVLPLSQHAHTLCYYTITPIEL